IISTEVAGLINWALVLVAVIAITMMIISAIQAIATSFNEDGTAKLRRTVLSVAAGIFIIILRGVITRVFGLTPAGEGISPVNPTPNALIAVDAAVSIVRFFLGFLGIIALGIVIYAGILMIFNLGDEGRVTKARELLYRAGIGLVVILVSLAIVSFVIQIA
ncbi:MAG: hypothetical protein JWM56_712, partial [Candidatus Peribacteria bacterium]|nr:hypothetical protein [Candidatus Peribacteria bacterium]